MRPGPESRTPMSSRPRQNQEATALTAALAKTKQSSLRCPFCHDHLDPNMASIDCQECHARHHLACWQEFGERCASCQILAPQRPIPSQSRHAASCEVCGCHHPALHDDRYGEQKQMCLEHACRHFESQLNLGDFKISLAIALFIISWAFLLATLAFFTAVLAGLPISALFGLTLASVQSRKRDARRQIQEFLAASSETSRDSRLRVP